VSTYRIDLGYDGTGFHGYARQHGLRTVQGSLETALFHTTGVVKTVVAGRTDRGVHAAGQVVSFVTDTPIDTVRLLRSLNRQLRPDIAVKRVVEVRADFHARFSATARRYRYLIWNGPIHDPLTARTTWHVPERLDVAAMDRSVVALVGSHDFFSFCRRAPGRTTDREVMAAAWVRTGDVIELSIAANAFCHHMVRSIVATSVEIGRGKLPPASMKEILDAKDRSLSTGTAPPQGLTLLAVTYDATNPGFVASYTAP